jgi:hypothetical protein
MISVLGEPREDLSLFTCAPVVEQHNRDEKCRGAQPSVEQQEDRTQHEQRGRHGRNIGFASEFRQYQRMRRPIGASSADTEGSASHLALRTTP